MNISKSTIFITALLITLLWTSLPHVGLHALSEKKSDGNGVNHALIIGIGDYEQWPKLQSPPKDAKEIARILTEKYNFEKKNVTLLTDDTKDKPTLVTIVTYLDQYTSQLKEKDNLLIFFSGHSTEDEEGETYWIPRDAKEKLKMTWLRHSEICEEYLASDKFKAKNVAILTDSVFSKKILKPASIALSPYDLRYPEKIREKAQRRSREVIAFGDRHWPGSESTEGFGLFTYYLRKALIDNWFKVIDLENLIFNEDTIFQIRKIAGTRLLRGRLKDSPMEKGGQTIITRVISPPPVNITDAYVTPKKGFAGDKFIIGAVTSRPAWEVYVEVGGKRYLMDGEGTEWSHSIKVASIGRSSFKVLAINEDDMAGEAKKGEFETVKPVEGLINVTAASVSPKKGTGGDEFHFVAKTDGDAEKATLIIEGNRYQMTGSGKDWSLKQKVEEIGSVVFSIVALNEDGIEGRPQGGTLSIAAPEVHIAKLASTPDKGFEGDEFLIQVNTDHPARSVELNIADKTYEMEGSGKEWSLKKDIPDIGTFKYTVIAKNMDGKPGPAGKGQIITAKRPAGIADVLSVSVSPGKIRVKEDFSIKVKTSAEAQEVSLVLAGKTLAMEGSGTEWRYSTQIAKVGDAKYKITAKNKDGKLGKPKEGNIRILEEEKAGIELAKVEVSPESGSQGQTFTFKATTVAPAKGVVAVIGDKRYKMAGSGTSWSFKKKIDDLGTIDFSVVASDKNDIEGGYKSGTFVVKALLTNVIDTKVTADKGFAGEEFTITASTDNPASSVSLNLDGVTYEMEGSGKKWQLKRVIHDVGKKDFTVTAKNVEGATGKSGSGEINVKLPIPDVTTVALSTEEIFAGDDFMIRAKTNAAAEKVVVEIDGKRLPMIGAGTEWSLNTKIAKVGTSKYKVIATNQEGKSGGTKDGDLVIAKKPAALINIAKAEVDPQKGYAGGSFTFKANTDMPAQSVTLTIGGKEYEMKGSGSEWTLEQKIEKTGSLVFSMIATNEDNVEGVAKTASFEVQELKERYTYNDDGTITDKITGEVKERFKDNGNGTITDLATNLMWLQSPKTIAVGYEEAEEYCRELDSGGYSGWRLPTAYEWSDLIDKSQKAPALPPGHPFKNIVFSVFFWSKTKHKSMSQRIYVADLYTGKIGAQSKNNQYIVWPVRYAEAGGK